MSPSASVAFKVWFWLKLTLVDFKSFVKLVMLENAHLFQRVTFTCWLVLLVELSWLFILIKCLLKLKVGREQTGANLGCKVMFCFFETNQLILHLFKPVLDHNRRICANAVLGLEMRWSLFIGVVVLVEKILGRDTDLWIKRLPMIKHVIAKSIHICLHCKLFLFKVYCSLLDLRISEVCDPYFVLILIVINAKTLKFICWDLVIHNQSYFFLLINTCIVFGLLHCNSLAFVSSLSTALYFIGRLRSMHHQILLIVYSFDFLTHTLLDFRDSSFSVSIPMGEKLLKCRVWSFLLYAWLDDRPSRV